MVAEVIETFNASAWGQKIQTQAAKAALGDFDRFKLMVARVKVRSPAFSLPCPSPPSAPANWASCWSQEVVAAAPSKWSCVLSRD